MRRFVSLVLIIAVAFMLFSCSVSKSNSQIVATTLPVYEFTMLLCKDTGIHVTRMISEDISCLHDYSLQVNQMRAIEEAELIIASGAGLEDFMYKLIVGKPLIDASKSIELAHHMHEEHHDASHSDDPHIWLSVKNAKIMAQNIYAGLSETYPHYVDIFKRNLTDLVQKIDQLYEYGVKQLSNLSCRKMVTFHEGFSYFADCFSLEIQYAIEEESGSEASAKELKEVIHIIRKNSIPAVFTEKNGSVSAANIITSEIGINAYSLDMAISGESYFDAMYNNIDTIKEALG